MNEVEFIENLIDDLNNLPDLDEERLINLRQRSKMIIRKVFGNSSGYLEEIDRISFSFYSTYLHIGISSALDEDRTVVPH